MGIFNASVSQSVDFQNLAPVFDDVPGPLNVQGTNANDVINYSEGIYGPTDGLVTVNDAEPIDFTNKTSLTIQGQNGDDTINLNNTNTPDGLTSITVDGILGSDTLVVNANNQPVSASTITATTINIPGATSVPVTFANIAQVRIVNATDQLTGAGATVAAVEGGALNNVLVASFEFADATPPPILGSASDFAATIDWGDGTPPSAGTIVANGTAGFQVFGSHTYAEERATPSSINVTVFDEGSTRRFTPVSGVAVAIVDNAGASTTPSPIAAQATVADAPLAAHGSPIVATEGKAFRGVVATLTDADPLATIADFPAGSVSIDWGDGSAIDATSVVVTQPGGPGSPFVVTAGHLFVEEGSASFTTTITDAGGVRSVATALASIIDAPPTAAAAQPSVTVTEGGVLSGAVATFSENFGTNPEALGDYTATIDWGDGTPPTEGTIVATAAPGVFQVTGLHTYSDSNVNIGGTPSVPSGSFPISVLVRDDGGTSLLIANTATVNDVAITLAGQLNPTSDSGASNGDAITNVNQPNFFGRSEPGSIVQVFARPSTGGAATLVGQAATDSSGFWSITTNLLADGSYVVIASAIDRFGHTTASTTIEPASHPLVIDTVGPKVTSVSFDRVSGQIDVTFQDDRSGLDQRTVVDAANYSFSKRHTRTPGTYKVNVISATPSSATGLEQVVLTINDARQLRGGIYTLTILSASAGNGIRDVAGNALDGEFYGFFPSGNNVAGGNFVAELDAIHRRIFAPNTLIGRASPIVPPGTPSSGVTRIPAANPFLPSGNPNFIGDPSLLKREKAARLHLHDAALANLGRARGHHRHVE